MTITIKFFAIFRDLAGRNEMSIDGRDGCTVGELFADVMGGKADPSLCRVTMFAVNEQYVAADTVLSDGDRVAFIPPVSGG